MFYMMFQRSGMLETFMNDEYFVSFFMSYISSASEISAAASNALSTIIEQIGCARENNEKNLKLLNLPIKTINTSAFNFITYKDVCEPLSEVLINITESSVSEEIVLDLITLFINYSIKCSLNNNWIESIGSATKRLNIKYNSAYETLAQLATGAPISKIQGNFVLINPLVIKVLFDSYYETEKDVLELINKLCDFVKQNCIGLRHCLFDEHLLRFVNDHSDNCDKRIMDISPTIASICSSQTTVQLYLSLITPIENRYAPKSSSYFLSPLNELFDRGQDSPELFLYTSEQVVYSINNFPIKNGLSISYWLYVDTQKSKLFSLFDQNNANIYCKITQKKWRHVVFNVTEEKLIVYCDGEIISTHEFSTTLRVSSFKFCIGGSGNFRITNIIVTSLLDENTIKHCLDVLFIKYKKEMLDQNCRNAEDFPLV